jgi:tetrahydromethanopterin S-methyltransferase subunit H
MADIAANTGVEFKIYIDFVTSLSKMPFCIDAWIIKTKLEGAKYCNQLVKDGMLVLKHFIKLSQN